MSPIPLWTPIRSRAPVVRAISAPTSGTAAISNPVSELEMCCSATPRSIHGIAISMDANASTGTQCLRTGRSSLRAAAIGRRRSAAMPVRARTSVAGLRSLTATLIRRYGMPQITHMEAKSIHPRLLMTVGA